MVVGVNVWWVEGGLCIFLKVFRVVVVDVSLKASHVATRTEFMYAGVNLRVP